MRFLLFVILVIATSVGMSMFQSKNKGQMEIQQSIINRKNIVTPSNNLTSDLNHGYSDSTQGSDFN